MDFARALRAATRELARPTLESPRSRAPTPTDGAIHDPAGGTRIVDVPSNPLERHPQIPALGPLRPDPGQRKLRGHEPGCFGCATVRQYQPTRTMANSLLACP